MNSGVCIEGVCECPEGFVGERCELIDISGYLGTYQVEYEGCFSTSPDHKVAVSDASAEGFSIQFLDLGDYQCPGDGRVRVNANVSMEGIDIPEQVVCVDAPFLGYTFSGGGDKEADTIRLGFKVVYEADGIPKVDSCRATLVKE